MAAEATYNLKYARLLSLGYGHDRARLTAMAHASLVHGAVRLVRCKRGRPEDKGARPGEKVMVFAGTSFDSDDVLAHDDELLPEWEKFSGALSSAAADERGYIHLSLHQVQLNEMISGMLLRSINFAPLRSLLVSNNGRGSDIMKFVVSALETNGMIEDLAIVSNHIDSEQNAILLVDAVNNHPILDGLFLQKCGIGQKNVVMDAIAASLHHLKQVSLRDNSIGSHGAVLVSECLARNPRIKKLDLCGNLLDDGDAKIIAESLKVNTNLRILWLRRNKMTQAGTKALTEAVRSRSNLNSLYNSNHTCWIKANEDGEALLSNLNCRDDPVENRKFKILNAVTHNSGYIGIRSLAEAPLEIMPRVLSFIQDGERFTTARRLGALFLFIREWNIPLLYTGYIRPKPRRRGRIKRKKIMQLVGKWRAKTRFFRPNG